MGWSESYFTDIEREAACELREISLPLLESLEYLTEVLDVYGDFVRDSGELRVLLDRLKYLLGGCIG